MDRRGFLGTILAAGCAPWIAKAGVLMPVRSGVWTPADDELFFDPRMDAYDNLRGSFEKGDFIMRGPNGEWLKAQGNPAMIGVWDGKRVLTTGMASGKVWAVPAREVRFV